MEKRLNDYIVFQLRFNPSHLQYCLIEIKTDGLRRWYLDNKSSSSVDKIGVQSVFNKSATKVIYKNITLPTDVFFCVVVNSF